MLGKLVLCQQNDALCAVYWSNTPPAKHRGEARSTPLLLQAERELQEYFARKRQTFSLPLTLEGTPFQISVWKALQTIPYGETRTYQEVARLIGRPQACRAVGMANHLNPLSLVIPCHRVIGANGRLTGYAGGLSVKEKLLQLESGGVLPYVKLTSRTAK